MSRILLDLKIEAEKRLHEGKLVDALKVYRLLLEAAPLDFDLRMKIADIYAANDRNEADVIYSVVANHDIKTGNPHRALVALKLLSVRNNKIDPLLDLLVSKYSAGSPVLGRSIKPAPTNWNAPVRDDVDLDYPMDDAEVLLSVAKMAAYTDNIQNYPEVVPPIAIFSTLDSDSFGKLINLLKLKRFTSGDKIVREGTVGDAVYFVARGEVRVMRKRILPGKEQTEIQLARLGPGSLFGEMALVSMDPRGASVICEENVDVLELKKDLIEELAEQMPNVAGAMARFTRERLIANVLATNPMFANFDDASKRQLLGRFTGHEVPSGTVFIEQGKTGLGLYLILQGSAEVLKWNDGEHIKITDLKAGSLVGEISLINEEPSTATVRTTNATTLLFLAKELFLPLIEAVPELFAHFAKLANERLDDTEFKLMQSSVLDDDFIESLDITDDEEDFHRDDLVCI